MAYVFLVGLIIAIMSGIGYAVASKKSNSEYELSWGRSILTGLYTYFISLLLGALFTSILQSTVNENFIGFLGNIILHTFGILFYAVLFSFFLVLPALIFGLKFLSKTTLTSLQKQLSFTGLSFLLVLIMNALMTDFFKNTDFMLFLAGFSFFGIVVSWYFAKKVFKKQ